jgi:hypothetical protein
MNRSFGPTLFATLALFVCVPTPTSAQTLSGIIRFANDELSGINAPFFSSDGLTRISGPRYLAALYAGPRFTPPELWSRVGGPQPFLTGVFAGFWEPVNVPLPGVSPGSSISLQVRFWDSFDGAFMSYEEAQANGADVGVSITITVVLNGGFPPTPTRMTGLQSASLVPTLTLTRGLPGLVSSSTAGSGGMQLTNLCGVRVGTNRWFRVASSFPGDALVASTGSSIDTVMTAFQGSLVSPSALTPIACNDDRGPGMTESELRFAVDANRLYLVCVAGKYGAEGTIQLSYTLTTPLAIRRTDPGWIELSWPVDATNFVLESGAWASSLEWMLVTNTPSTFADKRVLHLNCPTPHQVYRLRLVPGL